MLIYMSGKGRIFFGGSFFKGTFLWIWFRVSGAVGFLKAYAAFVMNKRMVKNFI